MNMYRGRGRGVQGNGMLYMLAAHAASKFMQLPRKPPVTAALILLQTLIYLRPGQLDKLLPTVSEVCLNPYIVLKVWPIISSICKFTFCFSSFPNCRLNKCGAGYEESSVSRTRASNGGQDLGSAPGLGYNSDVLISILWVGDSGIF